jgi:hypothetical protein
MSLVASHGNARIVSAPDYWRLSRQPLASLAFIAPLLVAYEFGVLVLDENAARNGADVWLRQLLDLIGFGQYFLLPALTVSILVGWHHATRQPWRVSPSVLYGMAAECFVLTFLLRLTLELQTAVIEGWAGAPTGAAGALDLDISWVLPSLVGYLGAGVYEELLFRLVLLSLMARALQQLGASQRRSLVAAVAFTSVAFAVAHYIGPGGDAVHLAQADFWLGFSFRVFAGTLFGALFVCRGFGIAAGTHAGYDILVGVLA